MIDGLLQSIPHEDFYRHRDFRPIVIEAIRNDEKPFLALLAAPGEWDVELHPVLPLYAAFKTNSRDNSDIPSSHWQLIFTAIGREESFILPWNESNKTPPSEESKATPPPPGHSPKVTYSFDQDWRDVKASQLMLGPKEWKVALHAGSFLSNPILLKIKNGKPEPIVGHPSHDIKKSIADFPETLRKQFSRTPFHPIMPKHGVVFSNRLESGTPGHPGLLLAATFALPSPAFNGENFHIQLFLTSDDIPQGIKISLSIPKVFLETDGKIIQGYFNVDLRPYFINSEGTLLAPKVLYITAIRSEYIGEPHQIEILSRN